jgi:hypothetical protein
MHQLCLVVDYVEKFSKLFDQLTAYGHVAKPVYYTMRSVEGLKDDFYFAVSLHRPIYFDIAASLALLQEEISGCVRVFHQQDTPLVACFSAKGPHSLPALPIANKQDVHILPEEKICEGKSPEEL